MANTAPVPTDTTPIDPGDARGAGSPGWPAIGDTKVIDGRLMQWTGNMWAPAVSVAA